MDDEVLLNIALIVSMIGIASLLVISYMEKIPKYEIDDISRSNLGEKIQIEGKISSVLMHSNSITLALKSECSINVYVSEKYDYPIGSRAKITGIVEEYDEKIHIRAEKIEIINDRN